MKSFKDRIRKIIVSERKRPNRKNIGSNEFRKQMIRNLVSECGIDLEKEDEPEDLMGMLGLGAEPMELATAPDINLSLCTLSSAAIFFPIALRITSISGHVYPARPRAASKTWS